MPSGPNHGGDSTSAQDALRAIGRLYDGAATEYVPYADTTWYSIDLAHHHRELDEAILAFATACCPEELREPWNAILEKLEHTVLWYS